MSKPFLKGAAFGALIASVATLFLAPQTGKKTQASVKKLVDSLSDEMLKRTKNLKKMSRSGYEEMVVSAVKNFSKSSKVGKEYLDDVALALKDRWDDFRQDLELEEIVEKKPATPATKTIKKTTNTKKVNKKTIKV